MTKGYCKPDFCYSCIRFPLYIDSVKTGWTEDCTGRFEQHRWNDPACVLHLPAPNERERERIADTLENPPRE
jgi:hypothetical protein